MKPRAVSSPVEAGPHGASDRLPVMLARRHGVAVTQVVPDGSYPLHVAPARTQTASQASKHFPPLCWGCALLLLPKLCLNANVSKKLV